jgi:transcriptional regulator with XRE-family HTH domain
MKSRPMLSAVQVKSTRQLMEWTQRDLASLMGVNRSAVASIETRKRQTPDMSDRLWEALDQAGIEFTDAGEPRLKDPEHLARTKLAHLIHDGFDLWLASVA